MGLEEVLLYNNKCQTMKKNIEENHKNLNFVNFSTALLNGAGSARVLSAQLNQ